MKYKFLKSLLIYITLLTACSMFVMYKTNSIYNEGSVYHTEDIATKTFAVVPEEINEPFEKITVSRAVRFLFYTYKAAQTDDNYKGMITDDEFYNYIYPYVPLDGQRYISRGEYAVLVTKMIEFMNHSGIGDIRTYADINEIFYIPGISEDFSYSSSVYKLYRLGVAAGIDADGGYRPDDVLTGSSARLMAKRAVEPSLRVKIEYPGNFRKASLDVAAVLQNPELPTGCEITSLTTVLNYLGFDAEKCDMADNYLDKGDIGVTDYRTAFVGNPKDSGSYGCYAPVIVNAAKKYLKEKGSILDAYNTTGLSLEELFALVDKGYPVIIWGTIDMCDSFESTVWNIGGLRVPWIAKEHCMVLHGYDREKGVVLVADPLRGNVEYDMDLFETRFKELFMQSVIIK